MLRNVQLRFAGSRFIIAWAIEAWKFVGNYTGYL
jgi:hypothetical protein